MFDCALKIGIVAAEKSGDTLGANLITSIVSETVPI